MKKSRLIFFLFFLFYTCQAKDCVIELSGKHHNESQKLHQYEECLQKNIYHWYEKYDNLTLFNFLTSCIHLLPKDKSWNFGQSILYDKQVPSQLKAGLILCCLRENYDLKKIIIKPKGLSEIIVFMLKNNQKQKISSKEIANILNKASLESILFFLDYISFRKDIRFKKVLSLIDAKRFKTTTSSDMNHSDFEVLEITIDAVYGSLSEK